MTRKGEGEAEECGGVGEAERELEVEVTALAPGAQPDEQREETEERRNAGGGAKLALRRRPEPQGQVPQAALLSGCAMSASGKRPAYFRIHSAAASWVVSTRPSSSSTSCRYRSIEHTCWTMRA